MFINCKNKIYTKYNGLDTLYAAYLHKKYSSFICPFKEAVCLMLSGLFLGVMKYNVCDQKLVILKEHAFSIHF